MEVLSVFLLLLSAVSAFEGNIHEFFERGRNYVLSYGILKILLDMPAANNIENRILDARKYQNGPYLAPLDI